RTGPGDAGPRQSAEDGARGAVGGDQERAAGERRLRVDERDQESEPALEAPQPSPRRRVVPPPEPRRAQEGIVVDPRSVHPADPEHQERGEHAAQGSLLLALLTPPARRGRIERRIRASPAAIRAASCPLVRARYSRYPSARRWSATWASSSPDSQAASAAP